MSATITELTPTDARIAADINRQSDQAVQKIRADRKRMLDALRSGTTDVPLVPVPFAERCASPLWDSLVQKPRCLKCHKVMRLTEFTQSEKELKRNATLRYKAYRTCDHCREATR